MLHDLNKIIDTIERRKSAILRKQAERGDFLTKRMRRHQPTVKVNDRVDRIAALKLAENIAYNEGRPQHEHKTTSVRKLRKSLRNTDPDTLTWIEQSFAKAA